MRLGCAIVLVVGLACVVVCRRPLLEAAAGVLVADEPVDRFDFVLVDSGSRCCEEAATLYREEPSRRILLLASRPGRLQRFGILPTPEQQARESLQARGVPAEAIVVIPCREEDSAYPSDRLRAWMADHPRGWVLLLCDRFGSRARRVALDSRLPPDEAARVAVRALPNGRFEATDWWQSRQGAKEVVTQMMVLAYVACRGEDPECAQEWDPVAYEESLRMGEEAP